MKARRDLSGDGRAPNRRRSRRPLGTRGHRPIAVAQVRAVAAAVRCRSRDGWAWRSGADAAELVSAGAALVAAWGKQASGTRGPDSGLRRACRSAPGNHRRAIPA